MYLKKNNSIRLLTVFLISFYFLRFEHTVNNDYITSFVWNFCLMLINSDNNWILLIFILFINSKFIYFLVFFLINTEFLNFDVWLEKFTNITPSLTNGFFLIHPVFIFCTYIYIFKLILYKSNILDILKLLLTSFVAIVLGAWWANQELGWGGWWSWDMVEIINLILMMISLKKVHEIYKIPKIKKIKINSVMVIIYFHLCIRYDIFNSIHSFVSSFILEYTNILAFILVIFNFFKLNKVKFSIIDFNLLLFKIIIFVYIVETLWVELFFFKNYIIWYIYCCFIIVFLIWNLLKDFKLNNTIIVNFNILMFLIINFKFFLKNLKLNNLHFLVITALLVFFIKTQFDYIFNYQFSNWNYIFNTSDFFLINNLNYLEAWFNINILNEKNLNNLNYISFYNFLSSLKLFLTSNFTNFSYYLYFYDLIFIFILFIIIEILKNIIIVYTKYKIWCI